MTYELRSCHFITDRCQVPMFFILSILVYIISKYNKQYTSIPYNNEENLLWHSTPLSYGQRPHVSNLKRVDTIQKFIALFFRNLNPMVAPYLGGGGGGSTRSLAFRSRPPQQITSFNFMSIGGWQKDGIINTITIWAHSNPPIPPPEPKCWIRLCLMAYNSI